MPFLGKTLYQGLLYIRVYIGSPSHENPQTLNQVSAKEEIQRKEALRRKEEEALRLKASGSGCRTYLNPHFSGSVELGSDVLH